MNLKVPALFRVNDKRIRTAALISAGLLVLDLFLFGLLVSPSSLRLTADQDKYRELRKRRADAILFKQQRSSVSGVIAGVLAQKDMPLLVKDLVQSARRLNLSVSSVKYDIPGRGSGELALLSFSFPAEGRYADIKRFVYEVETSDRLVGIESLKMDSEKGLVKMDMKLLTYVKGH
jgi:Tfp pilus assembly protein PilO